MVATANVYRTQAWKLFVRGIAVLHLFLAVAYLAPGEALADIGALRFASAFPDWLWGFSALLGGLLTWFPRTRLAGLTIASSWALVWVVALGIGIFDADGPFYTLPMYSFVAFSHLLAGVLERQLHLSAKAATR